MTDSWLLNWPILTLSLFNTTLLLWLGLTILLNAERRDWGVWLIGIGLFAGAFFFVSHTAIFGIGVSVFTMTSIDFWWRAGWPALVLNPLAWYIAVLWYAGYWDAPNADIRQRQRPWMIFVLVFATVLLGLLLFTPFLPSFEQLAALDLSSPFNLAGISFILLAYPVFILLCTGLSLDVLLRPGPSTRTQGIQARTRARPWLIAASLDFLLVSFLVGGMLLWVVSKAQARLFTEQMDHTIAFFDLLISGLIAGAILALGQAFVAYEIFTGAALPRRGLARGWQRAIIVSAGYGTVIGGAFALRLHPIYGLLLTALLMTTFFALLNWRSFVERERQMHLLRPFVSPEGLYEQLLADNLPETQAIPPFDELIHTVLDARQGYLIPVGGRASLVKPYAWPRITGPDTNLTALRGEAPPINDLLPAFSPETLSQPVDPSQHGGATLAIPLWVGQGLGGVLLLGEKRDGSLYAQEEIELAQAAGERLLDTQASAELARRLAALQRRELAETQIADRRTRRALHDDILPQLHTALLTLPPDHPAVAGLAAIHQQISALLREMPPATTPEFAKKGVFEGVRQVIEGELAGVFDEVVWEVPEEVEDRARQLPLLESEVVFYAAREVLRNSAKHGRGASPLRVHISARYDARLEVILEDNGTGGKGEGGGGSGLALHGTMLAVVGGEISVGQASGGGTQVLIRMRG